MPKETVKYSKGEKGPWGTPPSREIPAAPTPSSPEQRQLDGISPKGCHLPLLSLHTGFKRTECLKSFKLNLSSKMAMRPRKRCSTSLIIHEMQIKTHTKQNDHHEKISPNNKYWRGDGEEGSLLHSGWGGKLVQTVENRMQVLKNLE